HGPQVLYLSSHQSGIFPGSGAGSERGSGNIVNLPLAPGSGSAAFRRAWSEQLLPALDAFAPQLLLVSAGFDGDRRDPLAQLGLEPAGHGRVAAGLARPGAGRG